MVLATCLLLQNDLQLESFKKEALKKEKEGAWKKIELQKDAAGALRKAGDEKKPILAIILVGHMAQQDAAEC
jgi:hypothetical protein